MGDQRCILHPRQVSSPSPSYGRYRIHYKHGLVTGAAQVDTNRFKYLGLSGCTLPIDPLYMATCRIHLYGYDYHERRNHIFRLGYYSYCPASHHAFWLDSPAVLRWWHFWCGPSPLETGVMAVPASPAPFSSLICLPFERVSIGSCFPSR